VVAGAAIYLSRARWRRPRPSATVPAPAAPAPAEPVPISFEIDTTVGTFRLRLTHHASSHRLAIVGPSGSGKTLALRTLAGLGPSGGQVRYGPDDVTAEPPEQRRIGYVPQGSGLLPARTVWEQVMFAVDADPARAAWWVDTLHIADLADRLPPQISGGQAQRTSLARALSRDPEIVFLDEPFSALDTPVRHELRQELHRLQQQVGLSTVLVTHDPEEAAMLADEIVVIADGRVLQAGTCTDVFRRPASTEIARLLDIENVREGTTVAGGLVDASQTDQPDHTLIRAVTDLPAGTAVMWSVHPHDVALGGDGGYPAVVHDVVRQGTLCKLTLEFGPGLHLSAWSTAEEPPQIGESIRADVPPPAVTVWVPEKAASVPTTNL
jgi:molybdate transport system permease protein